MDAGMFFSTPAAAKRLSLSPRTLELYRRTGEGPAFYRFGCLVRYLDADLYEWAAARRRESIAQERDLPRGIFGPQSRKPPRRAPVGVLAAPNAPTRSATAQRVPRKSTIEKVNGVRRLGEHGPVQEAPARIIGGRKRKSGS